MVQLHSYHILGIELSPSASHVLSWDGISCGIWNINLQQQESYWEANAAIATFFKDGTSIATVGGREAALWNMENMRQKKNFVKFDCSNCLGQHEDFSFGLAFSDKERKIFCGAGLRIFELDFDCRTCVPYCNYHERLISQLIYHQSTNSVFSTSLCNLCGFPNSSSSQEIICEWNAQTHMPKRKFSAGLSGDNPRLAISPNDKWLVIVEPSNSIRCLSLVDDRVILSNAFSKNNAIGVAFHPDGDMFAIFDRDIWVFTCPELKLISHTRVLLETDIPAWGCGFLKDGSVICCNSSDGVIYRIDPISRDIKSQIRVGNIDPGRFDNVNQRYQ